MYIHRKRGEVHIDEKNAPNAGSTQYRKMLQYSIT
jgi:hypothetical protein